MKINPLEAKSRLSAHLLLAEKEDVVITRYEQPVSVLNATRTTGSQRTLRLCGANRWPLNFSFSGG